MTINVDPEYRWKVISAKEACAENPFIYAVKTTGVFCRPGCASRLPKKENVVFFDTAQAARDAGYRPCKRCDPIQPASHDQLLGKVIAACRIIEESDTAPSLADLASEVNYSPSHFQRVFKTGE